MLQELTKEIVKELAEETDRTKLLILSALYTLGKERVLEAVAQAKQDYGKTYINDGSRLKTLCGCFFSSLSIEENKAVKKKYKAIKKQLGVSFNEG